MRLPVATEFTQRAVMRWNFALSGGTCAVSALASPRFAFGVAVGAALETANFRALWRSGEAILRRRAPGGAAALAGFGLRFALLGAMIYATLRLGVHPIGLLLGLSLIVPAVLAAAWRARPAVDPSAPALAPDDPAWERWDAWRARERELDEVDEVDQVDEVDE
jgi:hypothetical protein